jgi:3-methyladenine DNA glycosylase/8-oxoguanine DNA glycosylase
VQKPRLFSGGHGLAYDPVVAAEHLTSVDARLGRLITEVGGCGLKTQRTASIFSALVSSIVYQQLTGKAAATILARVQALYPERRVLQPEDIMATRLDRLRRAGLSRAKALALRDLAAHTLDGTVPEGRALRRLSDEEIIERLTVVRGIGRWTVEMLLIFRLGRPDVLPIHDYGVRKGFAATFKKPLPPPRELMEYGERWRPYRSVASWYLWRAAERAPRP